ncbi:ABC transporter ATP-binding protein [Neorhizobium sp. DT-125]|uniref:ABC transporter ATP-binding protein n=1 Tax=Neorhizobium sp. DT-125 TaxID=3396163 RepID=UPI003F1AE44E
MTAPALSIENLHVRYGGVHALAGVSFNVGSGEIRGLIGPNGSGKSTCIDSISGRKRPAGGRISIFGKDVTGLKPAQCRALGLSRSFQRTSIFPLLTVRHQIDLAARPFDDRNADHVLDTFGLLDCKDVVASELGYGQQRRLDLALALVGSPKLLLLDEPAAGLSREESLVLAQTLRTLARDAGITVLLVEHDMEVIFGISDHVTVFDTGRIIADGKPTSVRSNPLVKKAYLGSEG